MAWCESKKVVLCGWTGEERTVERKKSKEEMGEAKAEYERTRKERDGQGLSIQDAGELEL